MSESARLFALFPSFHMTHRTDRLSGRFLRCSLSEHAQQHTLGGRLYKYMASAERVMVKGLLRLQAPRCSCGAVEICTIKNNTTCAALHSSSQRVVGVQTRKRGKSISPLRAVRSVSLRFSTKHSRPSTRKKGSASPHASHIPPSPPEKTGRWGCTS